MDIGSYDNNSFYMYFYYRFSLWLLFKNWSDIDKFIYEEDYNTNWRYLMSKKRHNTAFFDRERTLNKMLHRFQTMTERLENKTISEKDYNQGWRMRNTIKNKLYLQEQTLWKQSPKRKTVYFEQLDFWKYIYTRWKRLTREYWILNVLQIPQYNYNEYKERLKND